MSSKHSSFSNASKSHLIIQSVLSMAMLMSIESAMAQGDGKPKTLRESVLMAISLNPKTKSKDIQVDSMHEVTLAAQARQYPSGSVSCSSSQTNSVTSGSTTIINTTDCGLGASVTVYDGGSNKYNYLAAKEEEEAMRQRFNSTNPFIQNTKGALANETMGAFMGLASSQESIVNKTRELNQLQNILSITNNSDDQGLVSAKIATLKMSLAKLKSSYQQSLADYKYVVTTLPSENLESLEDAISSLQIPETAEDAVQISLQKNPDIQATNASLRAANDTLLAAKAALGPRISLSVNLDTNRNYFPNDTTSNYNNKSNYAGITISIPLSLSSYHYTKAEELSRKAAELNRDSALDDARHGLESAYAQLEGAEIQHDLALKAYNEAVNVVQNTQNKILRHDQNIPSIQTCLSQIDNLEAQMGSLIGAQSTIVVLKFQIQQLAGTVFDQAYRAHLE